MRIYITVEINESDIVFSNLFETAKLSIDIAFNKYKFDIVKDTQEKRLDYIAIEISIQKRDVLVGNVCYNLEEILYLNDELKKYNHKIDTIFIPSPERIQQRILEAEKNEKLYGRWISSSKEQVEINFNNFKLTLQNIKDGLKGMLITIVEC